MNMRSILLLILAMFSFQALGCPGDGFIWEQSRGNWLLSGVLLLIALLTRIIRTNKNFYVPLAISFLCTLIPLYDFIFGGYDCGRALYEQSIWPVYIMFSLSVYELYMFSLRQRCKSPNKKINKD
jgi:hypothetical protein